MSEGDRTDRLINSMTSKDLFKIVEALSKKDFELAENLALVFCKDPDSVDKVLDRLTARYIW